MALALLAASCQRAPQPSPHYALGPPYQADGVWYYPRESYELDETGLATVYPAGHADLTADGEVFDQAVLAAAHQTLQLPAVARLTNLENGRQVVVRINDRGPATPHRLVEVTRRTATLLGFPPDGVARVRVKVLPAESQAATDAVPGAPSLKIAMAPLGEVRESNLPPPGGVASSFAPAPGNDTQQLEPVPPAPQPLPETVTQVPPDPGTLFLHLGTFQGRQYAEIQRARLARLGAHVVVRQDGSVASYRVIIGPLASVQEADRVLDQAISAGVTDARIVVE